MSVESCRDLVGEELTRNAADLPSDARRSFLERISYVQADVRNAEALRPIARVEPSVIYVATPPAAVPAAVDAVGQAGLHRSARIVLDKPFGLSRSSAQELNTQVLALFEERNVFRIDHFLYHHTIQELVRRRAESDPLALADVLRLAEVEIRWDETRAAPPTSAGYCGVMRDMIQSHLLQLVAVITMDSPAAITRANLARNRLEALRRITSSGEGSEEPIRSRLSPCVPRCRAGRSAVRPARREGCRPVTTARRVSAGGRSPIRRRQDSFGSRCLPGRSSSGLWVRKILSSSPSLRIRKRHPRDSSVLRSPATTRSRWARKSRKRRGESSKRFSMPERRRTPLWVAARATNRALLVKAYGSAYLSEYRQLVARFDQRPKTVLNDIWTSAAEEVGAAVSGDWDSGFTFRRGSELARVDGWETHLDPPEVVRRALDKPFAVARLSAGGIAVPEQISFSRRQIGHAADTYAKTPAVGVEAAFGRVR